jgi:hypothetical protein
VGIGPVAFGQASVPPANGTIIGTVCYNNSIVPYPNALVALYYTNNVFAQEVYANSSGQYSMSVTPGKYQIDCWYNNSWQASYLKNITVNSSQTVVVNMTTFRALTDN